MKILITSGGTTEAIDAVRGITNFATGTLGKITAEKALAEGNQVILLAGQTAVLPEEQANLTIVKILSVEHLLENIKKYIAEVDVIIHSMAVSDYSPVYMTGLESLPEELSKENLIQFESSNEKKISSKSDYQIMLLKKTPKVIKQIKKLRPQVILVGFKLLASVSDEELVSVAKAKMKENEADFILANDIENIHGEQHQALLISKAHQIVRLETKAQIASEILKQVRKQVKE